MLERQKERRRRFQSRRRVSLNSSEVERHLKLFGQEAIGVTAKTNRAVSLFFAVVLLLSFMLSFPTLLPRCPRLYTRTKLTVRKYHI